LQTGAVQEVDHASHGLAQTSVISKPFNLGLHSALRRVVNRCSWRWQCIVDWNRLCSPSAPHDDDDDDDVLSRRCVTALPRSSVS